MSSAAFTWAAWTTPNSWENLADAANSAMTYARDATDVAAKFTYGTKSQTVTEYGRKSGNGDTWESVFGIPSGSTITAVQLTAWKKKLVANTKLSSNSVTIKLINDAAGTIATLINALSLGITIDGSYTAQTAGSNQTGLSIASNTNLRLSLEYTCTTSGTSGSASVDCRFDDFEVTVTYTPPATTYTVSGSFNALIQKAGIAKTLSLNALIQKSGIERAAALNALLAKSFNIAASLNALVQKSGIEKAANLNALVQKEAIEKTASADALIQKAGIESSSSLDAVVLKTFERPVSLNALVKKTGIAENSNLNALLLRAALTESLDMDGCLAALQAIAAELDALISRADLVAASDFDAFLSKTYAPATSLNAIIAKLALEKAAQFDAVIVGLTSALVSIDALLKKTGIGVSTGLTGDIAATVAGTTSLNAMLMKTSQAISLMSALIKKENLLIELGIDAKLMKAGIETVASMDAILQGLTGVFVNMDALLIKDAVAETALNALIAISMTVSTGMDAILMGLTTSTASFDGLIQKQGIFISAALDARITSGWEAGAMFDCVLVPLVYERVKDEYTLHVFDRGKKMNEPEKVKELDEPFKDKLIQADGRIKILEYPDSVKRLEFIEEDEPWQ